MERYYCEKCNEVVRGNEEVVAHAYMTGHDYYCNKDQVDTGFYRLEDRVSVEDFVVANSVMAHRGVRL